jgi:hypothetical protein
MPDLATRQLIHKLATKFRLPVLLLTGEATGPPTQR